MNSYLANLKIGRRLFIGFGILMLLLVGSSVFSAWGNNATNESMDASLLENKKMKLTFLVNQSLDDITLGVARMSVLQDSTQITAAQNDIAAARAAYKKDLSDLTALLTTDTGRQLVKNIEDALVLSKTANDAVVTDALAGWFADAVARRAAA